MKRILLLTLLLYSTNSLIGQIKEWQVTDSQQDVLAFGKKSPNGRFIAYKRKNDKLFSSDTFIGVIDTKNNNDITAALTRSIDGIFSEDSRFYISSYKEKVNIRYLESETESNSVKSIETNGIINSILVRHNLIYCSYNDGKVSIYDWESRTHIKTLQIGKRTITFQSLNTVENSLLFIEKNTGLFYWNIDSNKIVKIINLEEQGWFSPDGVFVYYRENRNFYRYEINTGSISSILTIPKESWDDKGLLHISVSTFGYAYNQDCTLLITFDYSYSEYDNYKPTYHIWNFQNGEKLKTINLKHRIQSVYFNDDNKTIEAKLVDIKPSKENWIAYRHTNNISQTIQIPPYRTESKSTWQHRSVKSEYLNETKKYALVIGNSRYRKNELNGIPVNDALDIRDRLNELKFSVNYLSDASKVQIDNALKKLSMDAQKGDVVLFFYAGHGIEVDGKNYLIPVDAYSEKKQDIPKESIALDKIIQIMTDLQSPVNLIYLDACRINPFLNQSRGDESLGFSEVEINMPTMKVYYATQPGSVAANGIGRNGVFTSALLKFLKKGINCDELMRNVTKEVYNQSKQVQVPWQKGSLINEYVF